MSESVSTLAGEPVSVVRVQPEQFKIEGERGRNGERGRAAMEAGRMSVMISWWRVLIHFLLLALVCMASLQWC